MGLEALAAGLPVIVSDKGGPKELIVPGETGFIAKADNIENFTEKIEMLAEDEGLRQRMATNAVEYARTRSWDRVFSELFTTYEEVIGGEVFPR